MTVAFDAAVESVRTGTTDPHTWTHTPVGTPRAIVVAVVKGIAAASVVSSVTYGGVAMTLVSEGADAATEPGRAQLFFLGSGIPTGAQTVSVDLTSATTDDIEFVSLSYTAAADCAVESVSSIDGDVANPSVFLPANGKSCIAVCALYSGGANVPVGTLLTGMSRVHDHDLGAFVATVDRQTSPSSSDFTIGYTLATDDVALAALNFAEVPAPVSDVPFIREGVGWADMRFATNPRRARPARLASAIIAYLDIPETPADQVAQDTGAGSDASSSTATLAAAETGTGTDAATAGAAQVRPETGTGTDAATETAAHVRAETGAGTDASTGAADQVRPETAAGVDASSSAATLASADTAAGTDAAAKVESYTAADSGAGTDAAIAAAAQVRPETGAGADAATPGAAQVRPDTAAGSDASTKAESYVGSDAGAGTDASSSTAAQVRPETGAGSDASSSAAAMAPVDSGTGTDAATEASALTPAETGAGTDAIGSRAFGAADQGAGLDTSTVVGSDTKLTNDQAAGTEVSQLAAAIAALETGAAADASSSAATATRPETVAGSDASSLGAVLARVETAAGSDSAAATAAGGASDIATGSDAAIVTVLYLVAQPGVGAELAVLAAHYAASESGLGTDTGTRIAPDLTLPGSATVGGSPDGLDLADGPATSATVAGVAPGLIVGGGPTGSVEIR